MPAIADSSTHLVPINDIIVDRPNRQRKVIDTSGLEESIKTIGLLHAIVIRPDWTLIAGERRLTACKNLGWVRIPVVFTTDLSPIEYEIIELEENIKRKELSWQEVAQATYRIHQLRVETDPSWKQVDTASSLAVVPAVVTNHIKVAEQLADKRVASCKTMTEALTMIERTESRKRSNDLSIYLRRKPTEEELSDKLEDVILNESFLEWAPKYNGAKFNFIHCDFPYGIGVADGPVGRGLEHTFYDDTPEAATLLLNCFVENINRFFGASGHIMFWYSDKNREEVFRYLAQIPAMLWIPHPLIWVHEEAGISPDYRRRPKHVYDTCLLGTRDRYILKVLADVKGCPTDTTLHPSTKPEPMLRYFMEMLVDQHTYMLDPTCGSGASLRAAEALGARRVLGLEIDPNHCESARKALREARLFRGPKQ